MTRPPGAGRWRLLVAVLASVVLAGCGVQVQQEAQPLPSGALQSPSQTPEPTPTVRATTVYFVSGRFLEGVREPVANRSAEGVMEALALGPPVDQQSELRTLLIDPLSSLPMLSVTGVTPSGEVTLQRTDAFLGMPPVDQSLLVGQVVHSLADVGLSRVVITDPMGEQMTLSLPDGRVITGAVTAEDYAILLAK